MSTVAERLKVLDKLAEGFNKTKGKSLIGRISQNEDLRNKLKVEFIETPSLNVNEALGGGWPKGRISIVSGNEDSGKTFHLLETIGNEMKRNPDFIAGWLESEGSLSLADIELFGIDPERFFYLEIDREGAAEQALDAVESALVTGSINMFVINSLKCLVPSEEYQKAMGNVQVGLQARMNAKMMRKLTAIVSEHNVAFVMVQHLTTQIGVMHGDPLTLAGGKSIRYGASLIVDFRKRSIQDSDPISREEGLKIGVSVTKNHVVTNRYPYLKTHYYGLFGVGTEKYLETLQLAIEHGHLVKAGAFIKVPDENGNPVVLEDGTKLQWQGASKFRQYCMDNPEFFEELQNKLKGISSVETLSEEEVNNAKQENEGNIDDVDTIEDVIADSNKKKKKK